MYKLTMRVPNIVHKSWWWFGEDDYTFNTLDELLVFMASHIPMERMDIAMIENLDKKCDKGRVVATSWYEIYKGVPQLAKYSSF